jgi:D-lactate dehydrogenase (cytochrome)
VEGPAQCLSRGVALRPGATGWSTDVCVPISRLAECILETKADLPEAAFPRRSSVTSVTAISTSCSCSIPTIAPKKPKPMPLNERDRRRALALGGTCTGEHGIGLGKKRWLREELGDAVDVMQTITDARPARPVQSGQDILKFPSSGCRSGRSVHSVRQGTVAGPA